MGKTQAPKPAPADANESYQDFVSAPSYPSTPALHDSGIRIAVRPGRAVRINNLPTKEDPGDQPDFIVFRGADHGWVLRDPELKKDYPFHSQDAALAGVAKRVTNRHAFIGADSELSVYGEPLEGITWVFV